MSPSHPIRPLHASAPVDAPVGAPVCVARAIDFGWNGRPLFNHLSFDIAPGLTWVLGGDGCGKTSLLRLLAGDLVPSAGQLERPPEVYFWGDPADPALDRVRARDWLAQQQQRWSTWQAGAAETAIDALDLGPHLDKTLSMLSTGSRRKPGLVAALASGARLTLLDQPFAALDRPSCRWLGDTLRAAAADSHRAWVVADHVLSETLAGHPLAGTIKLGDAG